MIDNGFRFYKGLDNTLHLDQIVEGSIYSLVPTDDDRKRELGFYDPAMQRVQDDDGQPVTDGTDDPAKKVPPRA